jgi:hypothetical protein
MNSITELQSLEIELKKLTKRVINIIDYETNYHLAIPLSSREEYKNFPKCEGKLLIEQKGVEVLASELETKPKVDTKKIAKFNKATLIK